MNQAGYTLTETLAALAVIGLATGGLTFALQVIGASQERATTTVGEVREWRSVEQRLQHWLDRGAPFAAGDADRLVGDANRMEFACGDAGRCIVSLETLGDATELRLQQGEGEVRAVSLRGAAPSRFAYQSDVGSEQQWPPSTTSARRLKAVSVIEAAPAERVLLQARVWREQRAQCAFDPILGDCR